MGHQLKSRSLSHPFKLALWSCLMAGLTLTVAPKALAEDSAYVREVNFEQARAKDFHRHEAAAEKYDQEREEHVDLYKAKIERHEVALEAARRQYVITESLRKKGISDEELDAILHKKMERENADYEASRESFIRLRDQIESAHHGAPLNENEEYGL